MSEIELSIIIVNWNTKELLKGCLDSVRKCTDHVHYEIIVVDNASHDDSVRMLKSEYPSVRLIVNESNEGFSRANNKGIRVASGKFILLLNSDTFIEGNVFFNLVEFMKEIPEVGICSPAILNLDGEVQTMRTCDITPFQSFKRIINCYTIEQDRRLMFDEKKDVIEAEIVAGVCFMVRGKVFREVGLLDENYFMYNEEDDFCRRARGKGWRIAYLPSIGIYHHRGGSYSDRDTKLMVRVKAYESDLYFFRKHYNLLTSWFLKVTYKMVFALRVIVLFTKYVLSLLREETIWLDLKNNWRLLLLKQER